AVSITKKGFVPGSGPPTSGPSLPPAAVSLPPPAGRPPALWTARPAGQRPGSRPSDRPRRRPAAGGAAGPTPGPRSGALWPPWEPQTGGLVRGGLLNWVLLVDTAGLGVNGCCLITSGVD
uniref:Uncharacterized protein n=1 Tax=Gadus morhua TaxID=8049 RepID=A0A8C5AHF9_GADMO